jgi:hypothetical protein
LLELSGRFPEGSVLRDIGIVLLLRRFRDRPRKRFAYLSVTAHGDRHRLPGVKIAWITATEAAQLTGVPAHRIEHDVRLHVKQIARRVGLIGGTVVTGRYFAPDVIREYQVRNAALKLALIHLTRLIERSKARSRVAATR